jgi:hypothetical protein
VTTASAASANPAVASTTATATAATAASATATAASVAAASEADGEGDSTAASSTLGAPTGATMGEIATTEAGHGSSSSSTNGIGNGGNHSGGNKSGGGGDGGITGGGATATAATAASATVTAASVATASEADGEEDSDGYDVDVYEESDCVCGDCGEVISGGGQHENCFGEEWLAEQVAPPANSTMVSGLSSSAVAQHSSNEGATAEAVQPKPVTGVAPSDSETEMKFKCGETIFVLWKDRTVYTATVQSRNYVADTLKGKLEEFDGEAAKNDGKLFLYVFDEDQTWDFAEQGDKRFFTNKEDAEAEARDQHSKAAKKKEERLQSQADRQGASANAYAREFSNKRRRGSVSRGAKRGGGRGGAGSKGGNNDSSDSSDSGESGESGNYSFRDGEEEVERSAKTTTARGRKREEGNAGKAAKKTKTTKAKGVKAVKAVKAAKGSKATKAPEKSPKKAKKGGKKAAAAKATKATTRQKKKA